MWKVTRDDELQHYGVPKMEWGKRRWQNKDGSLTPEGRIHYGVGERKASKQQKSLANSVKKTVDTLNPLYNHRAKNVINSPQVKEALSKVKGLNDEVRKASSEYNQMEYDWYDRKNPEMYNKYTQKYAEESSKEYGDGTKEDIERRLWLIRNDDLDQGDSFRMYLNDNPKEKAKYEAAYKKWDAAIKAQKTALKEYASELLGEFGDEQITARQSKWNNYSYTVTDQLASVMSLQLSDFYKDKW